MVTDSAHWHLSLFFLGKKGDTGFGVVLKRKNKAPALPLFDICPLHLPIFTSSCEPGLPTHLHRDHSQPAKTPASRTQLAACDSLKPGVLLTATWTTAATTCQGCVDVLGDGAEDQIHDLARWHVDILAFSPTAPSHAVGRSSKNPQILLGPESAGRGWGACSRNTTHVCTFCSVESQISSPPSEAPEMTHVPLGLETPRCTTFLCLYVAEWQPIFPFI